VLLCRRRCPINKRSAAGEKRATGHWSAVHQERGPDCMSLAFAFSQPGRTLFIAEPSQSWLRRTPATARTVLNSESFLASQSGEARDLETRAPVCCLHLRYQGSYSQPTHQHTNSTTRCILPLPAKKLEDHRTSRLGTSWPQPRLTIDHCWFILG
jgi:hypothetical protein